MFKAGSITGSIALSVAPLKQGFRTAMADTRQFGVQFKGMTFSAAESVKSLGSSIGGGLGGSLAGLAKSLAGPVAAVATLAAAAAGAKAVIREVGEAMEAIDATAKASDAVGTTVEGYIALKHAAGLTGIEMGTVDQALVRMQTQLADAAAGSTEAAAGFNDLGLDAQELINLPAEEALFKIGDAMAGIENPAERARAATEILGMRAGPDLLNLLSQGSAGLQAAKDDVDLLGKGFSRIDAAKVEGANDAMARAWDVVQGLVNTLAIELAPYVQAIAEKFIGAATAGGGFGEIVSNSVQWVATGVAKLADWLELLGAGWEGMRAIAAMAWAAVLSGVDLVGSGITELLNLLPGVNVEWTNAFAGMSDALVEEAEIAARAAGEHLKNFGDGANSAAVGQFFDDARRKSQEAAEQIAADGERMRGSFGGMSDAAAEEAVKATSALESLQRDVQAFGMSEMDKKLFEFKLTTDDPAQIEKYAALLGRLDELQVGKQVEEKVKAFRQSMQTPLDKFNEQAAEWRKWLEEGLISKDEFDAAVQKGQEDLAKNSPAAKERETGRDPQFASFVKAGSAEAIKLAFNAQIGGGKDELPQKQLTVAERSRDILGRIEEKLNFEVA